MRQFVLFSGLLCLAAAGPAPGIENVHELMTKREVMQVFHTEHEAVPEYEVVPLYWPKLHKRSIGSAISLQINAFEEKIHLWLHPAEDHLVGQDTPVYFSTYKSGDLHIRRITNAMADVGRLLEDKEKKASVLVKETENGGISISGNVGSHGFVLRPLPGRFHPHFNGRFQRSVNDGEYPQNITVDHEAHYHVVYKQPEQDPEADYAFVPMAEELLADAQNRSKRAVNVPSVIYPEVLVLADHETYKLHGGDLRSLLVYMVPFWNGVDLSYRTLQNPKVRFNIAGIIVGEDPTSFPFLSKYVTRQKTLLFEESLPKFSEFLEDLKQYEGFSSEDYDVAVALVPYKMCSRSDNDCNTLGYAHVGAACGKQRTGLVIDSGAFNGIMTAVHELGHLFGVQHDGDDYDVCQDEGYIMGPGSKLTENLADWSRCSMQAFHTFFSGSLKGSDPSCLFNEPKTTSPLRRVLPGRVMTLDEQCKALQGTAFCPNAKRTGDNACMSLYCKSPTNPNMCTSSSPPADGSPCAPGKICMHGKCMSESVL